MKPIQLTRRDAMKGALASLASLPLSTHLLPMARADNPAARYLFAICANGGADIRDAFMPLSSTDAAATVRSRPAADIKTVGNLRCIERVTPERFYVGAGTAATQNGPVQRRFLENHGADVAVLTVTGTSVNHQVAAQRWLSGAGRVMRGRTLLESHALKYATPSMPLPAVNMAISGYAQDGKDLALPAFARAESVANALLFGMATHPSKGVTPATRGERQEAWLRRARAVREQLDAASPFVARHSRSHMLDAFRRNRTQTVPLMEELDLITKLLMVGNESGVPLDTYGLIPESATLEKLSTAGFSNLVADPFMAQAALAYLLAKSGASCAVAISAPNAPMAGPGYPGFGFTLKHTPIAFDFSHTDHEATQLAMWDRTLLMADGLITLLKATPVEGGGTMWDRSLVYIPTEFGRTITRPAGEDEFGTGHELNNGVVVASPLIQGNRVYGTVDPATGLTSGVDDDGEASTDPVHVRQEHHVAATIGRALGHTLEPTDQDFVLHSMLRST